MCIWLVCQQVAATSVPHEHGVEEFLLCYCSVLGGSQLFSRCAACVWDVAWLQDGDLASACADYTVRLWTSSSERAAPAEIVAGLVAAVEARKQPQQGAGQDAAVSGALPPGLKMEEASVLLQSGQKDGETKIVKEGNAGVAYSWDSSRCAALCRSLCTVALTT